MIRGTRFAAVFAAVSLFVGAPAVLAAPTPDAPDEVLNAVKKGPHAKIGLWLSNLVRGVPGSVRQGRHGQGFQDKE